MNDTLNLAGTGLQILGAYWLKQQMSTKTLISSRQNFPLFITANHRILARVKKPIISQQEEQRYSFTCAESNIFCSTLDRLLNSNVFQRSPPFRRLRPVKFISTADVIKVMM